MTTLSRPRTAATDRLFSRAFVALFLAELAYFTADGVAIYALPLYVTGPLGEDVGAAGLAFGAFFVSALVLRPVAGRAADRWGRRPLLLSGALLGALGLALTPYAAGLGGVIALRLALGVAEAAFFVAAVAALVDLAPASRMGEALSYNSLGLYLGLALGPPLGEVLVRAGGYPVAWLGAAVLAVVAAVLAQAIPETRPTSALPSGDGSPTARPDRVGRFIHRGSVPIALAFLTSIVAMGAFLAFATLRSGEVGMGSGSLPLFLYGAVVVICRIAFAKVPDRVPAMPLGAAALVAIGAGSVVIAVWHEPHGLVVGAVVVAVGVSFSTPAFFTAIFSRVAAHERGIASGTASAAIDLGIGVGPIAFGHVARAQGLSAAFVLAAAVAFVGAAWASALARRR
jgi:predicted MFS family arabinose efflux permease